MNDRGAASQVWAVRLVQRNWRGKMGRDVFGRMRREEAAAVMLQRIYRGRVRAALARGGWSWGSVAEAGGGGAAPGSVTAAGRRSQSGAWTRTAPRATMPPLGARRPRLRATDDGWRGRCARGHHRVCRIQSMLRARAARLDAWKRRDHRNAAIAIQRVLRGHHGRRRVARERDR